MQWKFLNYNTLQYTIADPRYAVSHHSDGYSGLYGGATLVTAYRGTRWAAIAEPRYAVDYSTDGSSCISRENIIFLRWFTVLFVILTMIHLDDPIYILMVEKGAPMSWWWSGSSKQWICFVALVTQHGRDLKTYFFFYHTDAKIVNAISRLLLKACCHSSSPPFVWTERTTHHPLRRRESLLLVRI